MKKIFFVLHAILLAKYGMSQSYEEQFHQLFEKNDTTKIIPLLKTWEQKSPGDPELYVDAFNYYYNKSKIATVSLDRQQHGNQSLQFSDSTGKVAGYLNDKLDYDLSLIDTGFFYINRGIEKFPERLDMRFGKCYALEQIQNYDEFTKELLKTIDYSVTIKNRWFWERNKKVDDGEKFFLSTIQGYLKELYETENDSLLENMKQIGTRTLSYYPDNVEILSTTAVAYTLTKNYNTALQYLSHAEKISPRDFIVLNNIAAVYKEKGDKADAIKYYQLSEKYGDEQAKKDAKENIRELSK